MLQESKSAALARLIAEGARANDGEGWRQIKEAAKAWKPSGYDAHAVLLRHHYEGRLEEHLKAYLNERYPNTGKRMPLVPLNFGKLFAESGAAVFDLPAQWSVLRDGKRIDPTAPGSGPISVGDTVVVVSGKEHSPSHRGRQAEVIEARGEMLAVKFGGDDTVHRWYSVDEVSPSSDVGGHMAAMSPSGRSLAQSSFASEDAKRAEDFATMVREAQLDSVLAEAERRVVIGKTVFLGVYSDSIEAAALGKPLEPRTRVEIAWPNDVMVIPHPRCPTSLTTCVAFMVRRSSPDGVQGGSTCWELWTRTYSDGEAGAIVFGKWRVELVTETVSEVRGKTQTDVSIEVLHEEWPIERMRWVEWHHGIPEGCPFVDADRNLAGLLTAAIGAYSNQQFAVDFGAAAVLVGKTDTPTPATIGLGAGQIAWIRNNDSIETVQVTTDFEGIQAALANLVSSIAITNRQRPESFDAQSRGDVASGVVLKIKNEPQAKARLEAIARAVEVMQRLLAVMVEVHDHWRGTDIAGKHKGGGDGISFAMTPQDPPEYEDPEARQRRLIDARDAGLIDDVEARVQAGYSRTPEEARAALDKIKAQKASRPNALLSALDRLPVPPRPDDEPDPEEPEEGEEQTA